MIFDTNALSAYLDKDAEIYRVIVSRPLYLPVIVMGEYLFGLRGSRDALPLGQRLRDLVESITPLTLDMETVEHYADIRHELKTAGRAIHRNDAWIAALARQHRLPVVSNDTDLDGISFVRRLGW